MTLLARCTTGVSSSLDESRSRKERGSSGPVTAIGGISIFGDAVLKLFVAASIGDLVVSFDIRFSKIFFSFAGSSALNVLVSGLYIGSVGLSPSSFGAGPFGFGLVSLFSVRNASLERLKRRLILPQDARAFPPVFALSADSWLFL